MPLERWSLLQRILHWTIAVLVLGLLAAGLTIGFYGFDGLKATFGEAATNALYRYHKTFGVIVLALMVLRFALRLAKPVPPYPPDMPGAIKTAAVGNHYALYGLILAQPVLGWLATGAGGYPVEFFGWKLPGLIAKNKDLSEFLFEMHEIVAWIIIALLVLHISGALYHKLVRKDGVASRMGL